MKLSDCLVSLYNQAAVAAGDSPQDEFAVNYAKIEVTYKPQYPGRLPRHAGSGCVGRQGRT